MSTVDHAETENWLLLTDYASKYRISVSTLRRRIKAGQIQHRFEGGKYLILDVATSPDVLEPDQPMPEVDPHLEVLREEPILSTATRLLNELKSAYTKILQEKEEQLIQLKEEVSDLQTLVSVLESETIACAAHSIPMNNCWLCRAAHA